MSRARILFIEPKRPQCDGRNRTAEGMNRGQRCQNFAKYQILLRNLCGRHAARAALDILLDEVDE